MKINTKLIMIFILVFFISTPIVNATITYTEIDEVIDESGWASATWNLDKDVGSAPALSVAEILAVSTDSFFPRTMGVRNTTSSLNRYIDLGEAESSGGTINRFLVQVDASGNADFYAEDYTDSHFLLIGYWEDITFKEQWISYDVLGSEDDMWHETDGVELGLKSERVHLITITNDDTGKEQVGGVRNTTSALNRWVDIMESENGGLQTYTMFVQSDASNKIDVWSEQYGDIIFINQGYFDTADISYSENWLDISHTTNDAWTDVDLSSYLDEDGRVIDTVLFTNEVNVGTDIGIRTNGAITTRMEELTKAEGGGYSSMSMCSQTDSSGIIELYLDDYNVAYGYLAGYFIYEGVVFPNNASMNYELTITDMDDTDNLYSEKKYYNLDYDGYDKDGYANISYVLIYINQSVTSRAVIKYNEDTNTFSLISGNWEIDIGNCVASRSGTDLNLTFKITPSWDAIEESDIELEATINDRLTNDHDIMQTDYADIITTLIESSIECVDVDTPDRVSIDVGVATNFQVYYVDNPSSSTPSNDYPPQSEFTSISIYDALDNNEGSDISIVNGAGSVSFSESTVQIETYNLYIDMNDVDYTDKELTTLTETIIWDRIIVTFTANETSPVNVSQPVLFTVNLEYDYDNQNITDYTYDIERNTSLYLDDYPNRTFVEAYDGLTYEYDFEGATGVLYGITAYVDVSNIIMKWEASIIVVMVTPNKLYGAGINHTTPYIIILWNHSGYVDNFEVQHSDDNISYTTLAYTPNSYYNHTPLVYEDYHYYKVRATYYDTEWRNSSYTPINLERVMFNIGGGGGGTTIEQIIVPESEQQLAYILLPIIIILMVVALLIAIKR